MVVFRNIPPDIGGAATIINNLFAFADDNVTIVGRKSRIILDTTKARYNRVEIPLSEKPESKFVKIFLFLKSIFICLQVIYKSKIKYILGVYRDESSFILSYILSILTRRKLYVYMTDLYAENYISKKKKIIQNIIFKRAKIIFCLNQAMKDYYISMGYKIVEIIPTTIIEIVPFKRKIYKEGVFKIAFSGSIIYDRLDLLQKLVKIIGNNSKYHLMLLSPHDEEFLRQNELKSSNVSIEFVNNSKLLIEKLQECHLLYLPLTFNKPNNQRSYLQLKTCLATKSFEYMQTGVPILVHSPVDYFTYSFFKNTNSAIMQNSGKEENLLKKIEEISNNYKDLSIYAINAHQQLKNYKSDTILNKLSNLISPK